MTEDINRVLEFWFGELDDSGLPVKPHHRLWFKKSAATDRRIREQFGTRVEQALAGELDAWAEQERGLVALILLLDQFPRNIYRDTPQAFSGDEQALSLSRASIAAGHHQHLPAIFQAFLFMPLEHSENIEDQEACVALFQELEQVTGLPDIANSRKYAEAHRDIIAQFGRFPHRNPILGRDSSAEEREHLAKHGGF